MSALDPRLMAPPVGDGSAEDWAKIAEVFALVASAAGAGPDGRRQGDVAIREQIVTHTNEASAVLSTMGHDAVSLVGVLSHGLAEIAAQYAERKREVTS